MARRTLYLGFLRRDERAREEEEEEEAKESISRWRRRRWWWWRRGALAITIFGIVSYVSLRNFKITHLFLGKTIKGKLQIPPLWFRIFSLFNHVV